MNGLLELYWTFVRIGGITFGGGYAMLPILERELVNKRQWTTMDDLRDYFAIGQCTPGIIALNVSTFIGEKRGGVKGALVATTGFLTLPVLIILIIAMFLTNFAQLEIIQQAFAGYPRVRMRVDFAGDFAPVEEIRGGSVHPGAVPGGIRAERLFRRNACAHSGGSAGDPVRRGGHSGLRPQKPARAAGR